MAVFVYCFIDPAWSLRLNPPKNIIDDRTGYVNYTIDTFYVFPVLVPTVELDPVNPVLIDRGRRNFSPRVLVTS